LLTASTSSANKKEILKGIENGDIQAVFGTQSVIGESVNYHDLTLAVADEQHKFGVRERAKLEDKGANDILTLTATPIPRTLSLTIYDDIDVSSIEKRESAKTNITTKTVSDNKLADLLFYIKKECESGKQAFIVCPSIKDSEGVEIYSIEQFKKDYLQIFGNLNCSILTGKMSPDEKNQAMQDFAEGKTRLMVATSVIEVGIDTKASIIAVLNADRFGLASLHQLRGRIGRDGSPAYCFLHYKHFSEKGYERLSSLEKISDGLLLAEKDLDMRGAGDILGARQSGVSVSPWLGLPLNFNVLTKAKQIEHDNPESVYEFTKALGADYSAFVDNLQSVTLNS
ncbi:MAG: DNA helicase RecG, partial [Clostridia bacterium]|nr:DNA helicase RecG [Clostridia bacterium]